MTFNLIPKVLKSCSCFGCCIIYFFLLSLSLHIIVLHLLKCYKVFKLITLSGMIPVAFAKANGCKMEMVTNGECSLPLATNTHTHTHFTLPPFPYNCRCWKIQFFALNSLFATSPILILHHFLFYKYFFSLIFMHFDER